MSIAETAPPTIHRGQDELPWVDIGDGSRLQLIRVDLDTGVWVVRTKFVPGATIQTHRHTGHVDANGNVETVIDAQTILFFYRAFCEEQHGISDPPVIVK